MRIFDLLRGTAHKLLVDADASFTEKDYRQIAVIAQTLRNRHGKFIEVYGIIDSAVNPISIDFPVVYGPQGNFQRIYHALSWSAYLIRPDGYIGYRACPLQG